MSFNGKEVKQSFEDHRLIKMQRVELEQEGYIPEEAGGQSACGKDESPSKEVVDEEAGGLAATGKDESQQGSS